MGKIFYSKSFWTVIFIIFILGILLYQLIKIDLAKKVYEQKIESSKPVIEIKTNQK